MPIRTAAVPNSPAPAPPAADRSIDAQRALRNALGLFATGVAVITAVDRSGTAIGLTVNSFSSVSLDPPLVAWSLRRASPLVEVFAEGRSLSIHVLRSHQVEVARQFARRGVDRFAQVAWAPGFDAVPRLDDALARFDCRTESVIVAGDHHLYLCRVVEHVAWDGVPLLFAAGRYRTLDAVVPPGPDGYDDGLWF